MNWELAWICLDLVSIGGNILTCMQVYSVNIQLYILVFENRFCSLLSPRHLFWILLIFSLLSHSCRSKLDKLGKWRKLCNYTPASKKWGVYCFTLVRPCSMVHVPCSVFRVPSHFFSSKISQQLQMLGSWYLVCSFRRWFHIVGFKFRSAAPLLPVNRLGECLTILG